MSDIIEPEVMIETCNAPLVADPSSVLSVCVPMLATVDEHVKQAESLLVRNPDEAERAALVMKTMRADLKTVTDAIKPYKEAAQARHKLWTAFEGRFKPLAMAIDSVKDRLMAYQEAERKRIAAEQARLQAEADRKAREERERQEKAAREAREKEEAARRAADEARRKAQETQDAAERAKLEAEARRNEAVAARAADKAAISEDVAANQVAPVIVMEQTKVAGLKARKDIVCEIVDLRAFVKQAAENEMLLGYFDQPSLAANLKRARQANPMFKVDGVRFSERMV